MRNNLYPLKRGLFPPFLFFVPLFLVLPVKAEDNLTFLSQDARSLWDVGDEEGARSIYENLLSRSLPGWEQKRLFYNLGTLRLAQHQPIEAASYFQQIQLSDLLLPGFGRNLLINEGIADWQSFELLALTSPSSFDRQALLIEHSLYRFAQAQRLECQIQQEEGDDCHRHPLLHSWIQTARLRLSAVHEQKRLHWLEEANCAYLATFLRLCLQDWIDIFQNQESPSFLTSSFLRYFQGQVASLLPIWNALEQKKLSPEEKEVVNRATRLYLQAWHAKDLSSTVQEIKESLEALEPLAFQDETPLNKVRLSAEILLLQESLSPSALHRLLYQFESLNVEKEKAKSLKHIQEYLNRSLEELKAHHLIEARFFLLTALTPLASLFKPKEETPSLILKQAIEAANRAYITFYLSTRMAKTSSTQREMKTLLERQQQAIREVAWPWVSAVLKEQRQRFHARKEGSSTCQESPWDRVIPLYDRGYRAVQRAERELNFPFPDRQVITSHQQETIQKWEEALNLISQPPRKKGEKASSSEHLMENFCLIQEMSLEDQPHSKQESKELHSW